MFVASDNPNSNVPVVISAPSPLVFPNAVIPRAPDFNVEIRAIHLRHTFRYARPRFGLRKTFFNIEIGGAGWRTVMKKKTYMFQTRRGT